MNFAEMQELVSNHCVRAQNVFQDATTNVLKNAINAARKMAQRRHDFEYCRDTVRATFTSDGGGVSGNALASTTVPATFRKLKNVEHAYIGSEENRVEIEFMKVERYVQHLTGSRPRERVPRLYRQRDLLYLSPPSDNEVTMDIVFWLPDLVNDEDTDFLLEECSDWLLYQSLVYLNAFLGQNHRIEISAKLMEQSWASVLAWDASLNGGFTPGE